MSFLLGIPLKQKVWSLVALLLPASAFAQEPASTGGNALPPLMPSQGVPTPGQAAPMTDIHDIANPIFTGLSESMKKMMVYGGAGVAILALVLFCLWLWFRRKQGPKEETVVVLPPEVMAHKSFDRMEPLIHTDGKRFYFELSEASRHYIKGRFGVDAPEMTAEEFLSALSDTAITTEQKRCFTAQVKHAEPVKFAGVTPDMDAMKSDLAAMRGFVDETTGDEGEDEQEKTTKLTKTIR